MKRMYYSAKARDFLRDDVAKILGELTMHHTHALDDLQKNAWLEQVDILKNEIKCFRDSYIAFEYSIPRMGKRIDVVLLYKNIVFAIEFKVGEKSYPAHALEQALDYAVDLKNFHEASHNKVIVPVLISTNAPDSTLRLKPYPDKVYEPIKANKNNFGEYITKCTEQLEPSHPIDDFAWMNSIYKPTPTIIEAAQALYQGHTVQDISRSDSGATNLGVTSDCISEIIEDSKQKNTKSICFITGVPGAGKTLAGLNIANERHNVDEGEHAVFLSGNGPLVKVLQEALARNEVALNKARGIKLSKKASLSHTKAFIQNIHHFRDDSLKEKIPPIERVAIFDEAQRAWTRDKTHSFMKQKKGIHDFEMSEPEFLISVLDRHQDWAVIICLIGGGQEINSGEAGLEEWFHALGERFPHWNVYC